jgi:hypothetical protein
MRLLRHVVLAVSLPLVVLTGIQGCSKEAAFSPSPGSSIGTVFVADTLAPVESDWSTLGRKAPGSYLSKRMVVANWQGSLARSYIRFGELVDSTADIISAELYLYAPRVEGDVGIDRFGISPLEDSLDQKEVFWHDLPDVPTGGTLFFSPPATSGDSVKVDLTGMVTSWVKKESDNYGILIWTEYEAAGPEVLIEFASSEAPIRTITTDTDTTVFDFRPVLRISYTDTASEERLAVALSTEDTFVDTLATPFPEDSLTVLCGNGNPSRGYLLFDLSYIPVEASLTRAVLMLTPGLEVSSFDSMEVRCHALLRSWSGAETSFGETGSGRAVLNARDLSDGDVIELVITPIVKPWIGEVVANNGVMIKSASESQDIDFVRFHSHTSADTSSVPRLEIHYTLPPPPPFGKEE